MTSTSIVVNGRRISARVGDTLLDAALTASIVIPHDCATGQCETCRVRVYDGAVDDRGTRAGDTVLACRSLVSGSAIVEFDDVPPIGSQQGSVASVVDLTPDICEVTVAFARPFTYLPGQYVKAAFDGFPARDYSPTLRVDGSGDLNELIFQIRREPQGRVSTEIGGKIRAGSRVRVRGPFGHAYHRLGSGRLVLLSSGVGWAPIWAVARASRLREQNRDLVVVAGARHAHNLYMAPALDWLRASGAAVTLSCSGLNVPVEVAPGRPTAHLPTLRPSDTLIVAGLPEMVAAAEFIAAAAGSTCYADPFLPAHQPLTRWNRLSAFLRRIRPER